MTTKSTPISQASARTADRILVIDDEENIRETLQEFLTLNGYHVDTAATGTEGLDRLGREQYDLVLSDLRMPGVDGLAVIEWIKETNPDLPVLVMTGFATVESTIRALRLGAQDYLLKPFSLDEIERTIESCLEHKRLQAQNTALTEANERLREIERIKDDLLATVSHELRTPLTAMRGFLSLLNHTGTENLRPDQAHSFEAIADNVERLDQMIVNLLTLVEAQDQAHRPILEPVGVREFVMDCVAMMKENSTREITVEIDDAVAEREILVDRLRFPLVLKNLISNAHKFSRVPGEEEVILRARIDGDEVLLEVHDDGIGIAESQGEHVFERFTQEDMTATREYQGAGLGLAVVRETVRAHNGVVRLVPPVLGGTSVRVSLPVAKG